MLLDALDAGVALSRRVQVAVVGAGPVGITLARELSGCAEVLLVESGGIATEPEYEALNDGVCSALPYPLNATRTRQFGGATVLWAGYCAPFDAHDFTRRAWVPLSGWPFAFDALVPYYLKAAAFLNVAEACFDARDVSQKEGVPLPIDDDTMVPSMWRFGSPILRLDRRTGAEPEASADLLTLLHATVVDVRLNASHCAVTSLVVRTLNGREGRIDADLVVIACGGLESARLLLNADTQVPGGIGNGSGLLGRCFMEHPHLPVATVTPANGRLRPLLERQRSSAGDEFLYNVGLPAHVQEASGLLNARAHVYRTPAMRIDEDPRVGVFMEQSPNPGSRVTLALETDALGMRRLSLNWEVTDLEWHTWRESGARFREAFARAGLGRVRPLGEDGDERQILHSNHHLGTARMAASAAEGVVDGLGRVHGLENLYLMGGGVFPTVSWANPTLTVMALTYRLADHLRSRLSPPGPRMSAGN